jgi:hypothetical protein
MIKYNISIGCLKDYECYELDYLIDQYDARMIDYNSDSSYDYFSYIITEDNILGFVSDLPFDYFIKYILDDIYLQLAYEKNNKYTKSYIYKNLNLLHIKSDYKKHYNELELELYDLCKYIENNHFN